MENGQKWVSLGPVFYANTNIIFVSTKKAGSVFKEFVSVCADAKSTNDNYTDIKLQCILPIEYKDSELLTIKQAPSITCPTRYLQPADSLSFQYGGFVNKANDALLK